LLQSTAEKHEILTLMLYQLTQLNAITQTL